MIISAPNSAHAQIYTCIVYILVLTYKNSIYLNK